MISWPKRKPRPPKQPETWRETLRFLVVLGICVLLFRSLILQPFNIPSESMMPRLLVGDYLFVSKWSYGWSRASFPFGLVPISGRIWGSDPTPGDVVVFKNPNGSGEDVIKRVIGLPGDTIQMVHGQLVLNGTPVPKVRVADFPAPFWPDRGCGQPRDQFGNPLTNPPIVTDAHGHQFCRFAQFRETLPNGRSYDVLDQFENPEADDTPVYTVPAGHYFLMGDNRDNSGDSRFPVPSGMGYVPAENLVGKAQVQFFSTDGSAQWLLPWTWFTAARWKRIGMTF